MTTENKRDLAADLAICEAATDGADMCVGDTDVHLSYWQPLLSEDEQYPIIARFEKTEDALLFVESREGWPEAIRRAMTAEAEVERLRNGVNHLRNSITVELEAARSSAYITDCTFVHENGLEDMLRKIERYILLEVGSDVAE
ncbi:hypothetical protein JNUCC32_31250 (plasmid) [Paenibacillus sp. JNUCC32]|uniref:hypothetical protein n=1 Tax=Paenibacillus sp. JNUCC32 TaxID=2777984 RepID=UPI001787BCB0|nr:hypothetical protein [Paenibacillus sp. JNUCC-32]QOT13678.1 hypothetical protein JNUCC32_31250 [Paenibacillus sp. JNUCC-32]